MLWLQPSMTSGEEAVAVCSSSVETAPSLKQGWPAAKCMAKVPAIAVCVCGKTSQHRKLTG